MIKILGIETSCDDTCVALLDDGHCLQNVIASQDHNQFGGILPEYAARNHMSSLPAIVENICDNLDSLTAIAVTYTPGLVGSLIVGTSYAKALAYGSNKPIIGIHHIEGHILAAQYEFGIPFPYGAIVVSGGHTLIAIAYKLRQYELLGTCLDDAAGECFDKVARVLGLSQPGGPAIERLAQSGQPCVSLPITLHGDHSCNFSFSGLKTAAVRAQGQPEDIAASLQHTIALILSERFENAVKLNPEIKNWALVGGVASNKYIMQHLMRVASKMDCTLYCPSPRLCTDNALMIAYAGQLCVQAGIFSDLSLEPRGSMSLTELMYI